jgi:hypothetical protein
MRHAFVGFSKFWAATVMVAVAATGSVQASLYDDFETGAVLPGAWSLSSGVTVTNQPQLVNSNSPKFMHIPAPGVVAATNDVSSRTVWVDFYTKPVFFQQSSLGHGVESNLTAFFYANTNGDWVTVSGTNLLVQTWTNALIPGVSYPKAETNKWAHLAVCQDFSNRVWSLFVNEIPVATNLGFISNNLSFARFETKNFGAGDPVFLDNVLVSNFMSVVSATNDVASNGVPPSVALQYFGVVDDPRPAVTNLDAAGNSGVTIQFEGVLPGVQYVVLRGADPLGGNMSSNGVVISPSSSFTDANALAVSNRYFYKITSVSPVDGSYVLTNDATYAAYKQIRQPNSWYWVGIPVDYGAGRTVGGALGAHLARGLASGDVMTVWTGGVSQVAFELDGSGNWTGPDTSLELTPGMAVLIQRKAGAPSVQNTILVGLQQTNSVNMTLGAGWYSLAWPYDSISGWGAALSLTNGAYTTTPLAPVNGDVLYRLEGSKYRFFALTTGKGWIEPFASGKPNITNTAPFSPGEGFLIRSVSGNQWVPQR